MKYEIKIIDYANQNNGYIKASDLNALKIPRVYLNILMQKGLIKKVFRGIYIVTSSVEDELYTYYLKYKYLRYSRRTLLFLHNITNRFLDIYCANFPNHYNTDKIDKLECYRTNRTIYDLGFTMLKTPQGHEVPSYDLERCICELFLFPQEFDSEEIKYAIDEINIKNIDPDKLLQYAKKLKISKQIQTLLEVIR